MKLKFGLLLLISFFSFACADAALDNNGTNNGNNDGGDEGCLDKDHDGFKGKTASCPSGTDCNDSSAGTNPSVKEVCGDRQDNNCDGQRDENCETGGGDCVDNDGDRFGVGKGCFGPDCDDNDKAINPRSTEVCGNDVDEDCKDGPQECAANCTDVDGDGYGAKGSTDCEKKEEDCDDNDKDVNPGAKEICNGKDDNCNETGDLMGTDECAGDGQACVGDRCKGGVGSTCENADDCVGQKIKCDTTQTPKICRVTEGGKCTEEADCVEGLKCPDGTCTGNFCDNAACSGNYDVCDKNASGCVECPYFDGFVKADLACTDKICSKGGWCTNESSYPYKDWDDVFTINVDLAVCWNISVGGVKSVCWTYLTSPITKPITKRLAFEAYDSGKYDMDFTPEMITALDEIWGKGLFNLEDIDWNEDVGRDSKREICMWYEPGGTFTEETLVLDLCTNFVP